MNTKHRLGLGWARLRQSGALGFRQSIPERLDAAPSDERPDEKKIIEAETGRQRRRLAPADGSQRADEPLVAGRRARTPPPAPSARTSINQFARRAADELGVGSVLDVGPEAGRFRQLFDDGSYETMAMGSPLPGPGVGRTIRTQPVGVLPLPTEGFDLVICTGLLEWSTEPQGLLTELNRLMKPRGRLFLSAPLIVPEPLLGHLPNRPRFGLNYLIEAAGFSIDDLQPVYRARTYAVVAGKHRRPGQRRRQTD